MPQERLFQLALTLVPGLGDILVKTLVSYMGDAKAIFGATIPKLVKVPGIGPNIARSIVHFDLSIAEKQLLEIERQNIKVFFYTEEKYPQRLKNIYDAPALLYLSGEVDLNYSRMLAIVGTRNATDHGKAFVREFVRDLVSSKVIIVSGLAYGIDIEAHKTALQYDIPTIGVIASGLDTIYPQIHTKYARKMMENGGLVTEYPLTTGLDPARFPARNRIIAGLSDATVVVEAGNKGGALITADLASGYDREVFAVPGRYNDTFSYGCNQLIKNNIAQAITSAEDLQYFMHWPEALDAAENKPLLDETAFSRDEWAIISTIQQNGNGIQIDELSWKSKVQATQLASILLNLEFRGIVQSLPGKKYALN